MKKKIVILTLVTLLIALRIAAPEIIRDRANAYLAGFSQELNVPRF